MLGLRPCASRWCFVGPWKMTPTPDSNVRVARRFSGANARRARHSALARLLLRSGVKLLLSFAAASSMSACIIPVGPEWQDPPGAPNAAPEILGPDPTWGAEVTGVAPGGKEFQFAVTAPSADLLAPRWIVDGLQVASDQSPQQVSPTQFGVRFTNVVACQTAVLPGLSRHAVTLIVAD